MNFEHNSLKIEIEQEIFPKKSLKNNNQQMQLLERKSLYRTNIPRISKKGLCLVSA